MSCVPSQLRLSLSTDRTATLLVGVVLLIDLRTPKGEYGQQVTQSIATPGARLCVVPTLDSRRRSRKPRNVSPHRGADLPPGLLIFDLFQKPCLSPGRIPGKVRTVVSVPTWRTTYSRGQPGLLSCASHWGYSAHRVDGTTAGRQFALPPCSGHALRTPSLWLSSLELINQCLDSGHPAHILVYCSYPCILHLVTLLES